MLRKVNLNSIPTIQNIETLISSHVHVLTAEELPHFVIFVSLFKNLTLLCVFILQAQNIEGSSTLVGSPGSCLVIH